MRLSDRPIAPDKLGAVHQLLMNQYSQLIAQEADAISTRKGYMQINFDRVLILSN